VPTWGPSASWSNNSSQAEPFPLLHILLALAHGRQDPPEFVDELLARIDIVDLINSRVPLRKGDFGPWRWRPPWLDPRPDRALALLTWQTAGTMEAPHIRDQQWRFSYYVSVV